MKLNEIRDALSEAVTSFWNVRNERERSILIFGAAALVLFLLYAIFFAPALNGRTVLNRDLPTMRQQLAEMQSLAKEVGELAGATAPDPEPVGANAGTYADPTTHQLYFIPEGINDAFSTADFDFINQVKSVLALACASSSSCFQDFSTQLNEIVGTATQLNWSGEMQRVAAQIASYVAMDSKKPYSNDDVAMYQQQVGYFMTGRAQYVTKYLVAPSAIPSP